MRRIRYRLLIRSAAVFGILTALFGSLLITFSFEIGIERERSHALETLRICTKGIQSAHAAYAIRGEKMSPEILAQVARQYDETAELMESEGETAGSTRISERLLYAEGRVQLGEKNYGIRITRDLEALWAFRTTILSIYRALYLVFLPVGALCMHRAAHSITRPMEKLRAAADVLSAGNMDVRCDIRTGDELEMLSRSFNRMADRLSGEMQKREELIGSLAHEMKTPLQAIIGYADLIYMGKTDEERSLLALKTILHEARRLDKISHRMMEWIDPDSQESGKVRTDLMSVLRNVQSALGLRAEIDVRGENGFVLADRALLETLLINLADNSVNAGAQSICILSEKREGHFVITVADDGCGMDAETLKRAEEPFYREDKARSRAHGGAGLGLALCAKIAGAYHTRLKYESQKGRGTRISFELTEAEND